MKKLLISTSLITLCFAFIFSTCRRSEMPTPLYNTEFPNNTGTWWKYKMYDYLFNRHDTVTITVVGDSKLYDGTDVKVWKREFMFNSSPNDTVYVSNQSDGIRMYDFTARTFAHVQPYKRYFFPLAVGSFWPTRYTLDPNRVVLKGDTTVLAGTFTGAYKIVGDSRIIYGQFIREQEWFIPNIGMIYRFYDEINGGPSESRKWELVSYHIN